MYRPVPLAVRPVSDLERWSFELGVSLWQAVQQLVADDDVAQAEPGDEVVENHRPALVPAPFKGRARKALVEFGRIMNMLVDGKRKLTLLELYDLMVGRTGYKNFVKDNTPEGEERWENLLELRRVVNDFGGIEAAEGLPQFLEDVALVSDVDALGKAGHAPALLTLHTAKGLEFPVVFMVGMEENIFPHSRSMGDQEEMEEERRLAYVGMTRARDRLYLTRAFRRSIYGFDEPTAPSRFLRDIPVDLIDDGNGRRGRGRSGGGSPYTGRREAQQSSTRWSSRSSDSQRSTPKPATPQFQMGDKVVHQKFGEGTVISVEQSSDETYVQVAFSGKGIKKLAASIARLEKR
jgi:DNA helicase-2/ATP-dependent DNA helicase PcrA